MANTPINAVLPGQPKPGALENAAKVLGILGTVGGLAAQASNINWSGPSPMNGAATTPPGPLTPPNAPPPNLGVNTNMTPGTY